MKNFNFGVPPFAITPTGAREEQGAKDNPIEAVLG